MQKVTGEQNENAHFQKKNERTRLHKNKDRKRDKEEKGTHVNPKCICFMYFAVVTHMLQQLER